MQFYYIVGLGKSGLSALEYMRKSKIPAIGWDDNDNARTKAVSLGYDIIAFDKLDWRNVKEVVLSPGIPTYFPSPHPVVQMAKKLHIPITGDVDLWARLEKNPAHGYMGVTGTNGKSTTHAMIDHVLKLANLPVQSGGNNGFPVFQLASSPSVFNLELSSYQLEITKSITFKAAVLLNVTPDHISRHGTLESYIAAKESIFAQVDGIKVIGVDSELSEKIHQRHPDALAISVQRPVYNGYYALGGSVYRVKKGQQALVIDQPDLPVKGQHNLFNMLASFAVCSYLGVSDQVFWTYIRTYKALPHRQEVIFESPKLLVVNDSKATNAEAAYPALESYKNIYWILGGIEKEGGLELLTPLLKNVKKAYLIGENSNNFSVFLKKNNVNMEYSKTLDIAIQSILNDVKKDQEKCVILLSPAAASQDQFRHFEHRGDCFRQMALKLLKAKETL